MKAAVLSIGDELILGQIQERNAGWLSARLADEGVMTVEHRTVTDDLDAIVAALMSLASQFEIVITTGGLGPTDDDLLRAALARVLGDGTLVEDADAIAQIEAWFAGRGRAMPAINLRQARRPRDARCLRNDHGTAPGLAAALGGCRIWSLPGPPAEMHPMFEHFVVPALFEQRTRTPIRREAIPVFGLGESSVAERLGELMARGRQPLVSTTASGSIVTIRLRAEGDAANDRAAFDRLVGEIVKRMHPYALGVGARTLPEALAQECIERGARVGFAESCTGGLASAMVCEVPGASAWFEGAVVSYANTVKSSMLNVPQQVIEQHGAVSVETARAMVAGVMGRLGVTAAASITGVAGPDGGSPEKPVGMVLIATAVHDATQVKVRTFRFRGDRAAIRDRSARSAIGALRLHLRGEQDAPLLAEIEAPQ